MNRKPFKSFQPKFTACKRISSLRLRSPMIVPKRLTVIPQFSFTKRLCSNNRPFHLAFPVTDLAKAREYYGKTLGLPEGRVDPKLWADFNLFGNQIVAHVVKEMPYGRNHNPVDGDDVPVPHFGACLGWKEFETFAESLKQKNIKFVIEPHIRFKGEVGEQYTMFFKDPFGNALEFKAMRNPDNLFKAK